MKPMAPLRNNFIVFATAPCRGLSLYRYMAASMKAGKHNADI
jgi:hypothetical protein